VNYGDRICRAERDTPRAINLEIDLRKPGLLMQRNRDCHFSVQRWIDFALQSADCVLSRYARDERGKAIKELRDVEANVFPPYCIAVISSWKTRPTNTSGISSSCISIPMRQSVPKGQDRKHDRIR